MLIKVTDQQQYVYKYVQLFQYKYNLTRRELEILCPIVYRLYILEAARGRIRNQERRATYNPLTEFKKPEALVPFVKSLGIEFLVFRTYLKKFRSMGIFNSTGLNKELMPPINNAKIEIEWIN